MLSHVTSSPLKDCFQLFHPQLLKFFTRKTGSAEDARELTQDLWLTLHRGEGSERRSAENPQAYLFTMARNLAIDHLRRHRLAVEHAAAYQALHPEEQGTIGTAELVAQRQVLAAVHAALETLPLRTREVFIDHRVHGTGQDELALRHGVTRSTIERDVMRASKTMQQLLADWHAGADVGAPAVRQAGAPRRRQLMGALLGVGAVMGSTRLLWTWWHLHRVQWQQTLASATGQKLVRELPDGSVLTLDAASRATVVYYASRRQVRLHAGAAFFDVARAPDRPFVVDAADVRVTVLGTRFCVEVQPGQAPRTVDVTVESGQVQVAPLPSAADAAPWPAVELAAGDALRAVPGAPPQRLRRAAGQVAPWRSGLLSFWQAPLGEVADRLQRYAEAEIRITPRAAGLPITGEIRIAQAHEWLRLLPTAMPVRVEQRMASDGQGRRISIALREERAPRF